MHFCVVLVTIYVIVGFNSFSAQPWYGAAVYYGMFVLVLYHYYTGYKLSIMEHKNS